jgi:actin related protein 2/3 complex subunit 2
MTDSQTAGRIHLEVGHRVVAEFVSARLYSPPDKREAVQVKCNDFDNTKYSAETKVDATNVLLVSFYTECFEEVKEAVGMGYFDELYAGMIQPQPEFGFSITLAVDLDRVPDDPVRKDALVAQLSSLKRDIIGAPLWVCFKALLRDSRPPRQHYTVHFRGGVMSRASECMYVIPSDDLVVIVYALAIENPVEQSIARLFLQEIEISRKQSKDLHTAPSVTYTTEPPLELKMLKGVTTDHASNPNFIGFVSLAISKRNVEGGKIEKSVSLAEGYRAYLMYHVQCTKSQLHTRIRARSSTWLQVLNRAVPEKLNAEKKTIKGRTFKR